MAVLTTACAVGPGPSSRAPQALAQPSASASLAPTSLPSPRAEPAAGVPGAPSPSLEALERRLRSHYAQYRSDSTFAFIERDFAPRIEQYLSSTDVSSSEIARQARSFYANKTRVALTPKPGSLEARPRGERVVISFVLSLQWSIQPPAAAAGCIYLDDHMGWQPHPTIDRRVEALATLTLDAAGRFVAYQEAPAPVRKLQGKTRGLELQAFAELPTVPARWVEPLTGPTMIADGTLVDDLGETFSCGDGNNESDVVRKVRLNGRIFWLLASWAWNTGHNYVGEDVLVPAP
jgi:hypothetical protein